MRDPCHVRFVRLLYCTYRVSRFALVNVKQCVLGCHGLSSEEGMSQLGCSGACYSVFGLGPKTVAEVVNIAALN